MFRSLWGPNSTDKPSFISRLATQARIVPVLTSEASQRYERFDIHVPYWPFMVRYHLRSAQTRFACLHLINERIRIEIVEPGTLSEEVMILWRKNAEKRYSVERRLLGRWGMTIFSWHIVNHR